ncbi:hypothetical protein RN001_003138 [Aquatica leii]|uniref:Uncharacterized protein n=1 Tax=Aquatica leii TaxID=1421715 RepID=A0AAN7Q991_9COLE|nr:hypothetical protein RN001_003138 [Aquatica leii]
MKLYNEYKKRSNDDENSDEYTCENTVRKIQLSMRNRNRRWLLAWTFASLFPHIMLYEVATEHGEHLKNNSKEMRGIFTPRMDYEQWTPLGRGDPLKNDPTYDYVPPVLDRVHYWIEPSSRKPDSSISSDLQKTEILVLGVSSKKPSTGTSAVADSRKDTYEPFLKFVDGPKLGIPSNYQRMSRPHYYHHHHYHHHHHPSSGFENKNKIEEVISNKNEPIPYTFLRPPPITLNEPNTISFSEVLTSVVTTESPSTSVIVTKAPVSPFTVQQSSLLYHSSTVGNGHDFKEHFGTDGASSSQVTWRTPINTQTNLNKFNITYKDNINFNDIGGIITDNSQIMHKGQVSDDDLDIANTYVNIGKPEAQMHSPSDIISSVSVEPPKTLFKPIIMQLINPHLSTPEIAIKKITPMTLQTLQTMQTMKPPPILQTPVFQTSLHSLLQSEVATSDARLTSPTTTTTSLTTDPLFKHYKQPNEPLKGPMYLIIQGHSKVKTYGPSKQEHGILVQETNEIPTSEEKEEYLVKHLHGYKKSINEGRLRQGRSSMLQTLSHVVQTGLGAIDFAENEANRRNDNIQETELVVSYDVSSQTDVTSERYYKGIVEAGDIARNIKNSIVKIVTKLTTGRDESYTCLVGKTAIVTGSNTGIGFYTAQDFAKRGAKVILACRNKDRAENAKKKIIGNTGNLNVFIELVDFSSLTSVRNFAKKINSTENRLDILVNNAGIITFEDTTTEDGLSTSMQVNYLGPFLLTMLLIDLLKKTESSRIINVSSVTSHLGQPKPNNLNYFTTSFISQLFYINYANTKLCIILWTNELARKLKGTGVTANSLHPGLISTEIIRNPSTFLFVMLKIANLIFLKSPEEGAQTTIYAAVSKQLQNVSGQYFDNCKISNPPKLALDVALAKEIWKNSEVLIKLTTEEQSF